MAEEIPKWKLIDTRQESRIDAIGELMEGIQFTKDDIGKFFVRAADGKSGKIMTYDEMFALDTCDIGGWYKIGQLDVNVFMPNGKTTKN